MPGICLRIMRPGSMSFVCVVSIAVATALLFACSQVDGLPFPAPKINDCLSFDNCCPPRSFTPPVAFKFPGGSLPMRTRRAAHLVDAAYIAKYRRAYALMKELPRSDPRSLYAQARLHCAYCGAAFRYPGRSQFGLEIHDGWFFFPWHRMFMYFHERILASLIGDNTFALPFWNWDNQSPVAPQGNLMPSYYVSRTYNGQTANPLYNANRNPCALPPNIIDLNSGGGCSRVSPREVRNENNNLMYTQMRLATTPSLFFGSSYRFGWSGGLGGGNLEGSPHGSVHVFTGNPNARTPFDDMGNLNTAALDPLFYAHHANIDRLWEVWKAGGGRRADISEPDYLNSRFVFYDEKKTLVSISVGQVLNTANLRYTYPRTSNPWATPTSNSVKSMGGMDDVPGASMEPIKCSGGNLDVGALILNTPQLAKSGTKFSIKPLTFRVRRVDPTGKVEEVMLFKKLQIDWTKTAQIHAFLFYPGVSGSSIDCLEFFGKFSHIPEANSRKKENYSRSWKLGLTEKLSQLGLSHVSHVVVTLVQINSSQQIKFGSASIEVDK